MYRSRLSGDLDDITLCYLSSIHDDREIVHYDILGTKAHVLMLLSQRLLTRADSKAILVALEKLDNQELDVKGFEDIHEAIEAAVIDDIGMSSGGRVHTGRSRNDQVALDIRLKIRSDILAICERILDLCNTLISLAKEHQKSIIPLYTHLQQAQAGLFSHYLISYVDVLLRDYDRLADAFSRVNKNPLGAGPVGGTSIPIDRNKTTSLLGFDGVVENSLDATSARDVVIEYVSTISIMMTNLSRMSEDMIIWSTSEFSFIELEDKFTSPSSVMPQKKNPDILEITRGKTAEMVGDLAGILGTIKGLAAGYGRDLQQIKPAIWNTSRVALDVLPIFDGLVRSMTVNVSAMQRAAENSNLIALDVAEEIVTRGKAPFRVAHQIAGSLVRQAGDRPISELDIDEIRTALDDIEIDPKFVYDITTKTTVQSSLKKRISYGSSGYTEQKRMITDRRSKIKKRRVETRKNLSKITAAISRLNVAADKLIAR